MTKTIEKNTASGRARPSVGLLQQVASPDNVLLKRRIESSLWLSYYRPLRLLVCQVTSATVTLYGVVPTFFHKQLAQESIKSLLGNRQLINEVLVVWGNYGTAQ